MLKRMTTQKKIVFETLEGLGHASTEGLIREITLQNHPISLATIYRNIQSLIEEKKIKKVKLKNQDVLETVKEEHGHFICEHCGGIWDMPVNKTSLVVQASKNSIHQIKQCDIAFYGICHSCTKRKEEKENEVCL